MPLPTPPIFPITPGAGSADPDVVTLLAHNDSLYLQQFIYYNAVVDFLNRFASWKINSQQRISNGQPVDPPPVPPPGYSLPEEPEKPAPPPPSFTPIIGLAAAFPGRPTFYPAPGDNNKAGTVVLNPFKAGKQLIRVEQPTPFGTAHYWEEAP